MATGEITVSVSGGVGPFNYEVSGPVSPPPTSSNVITGLPPGTYTVTVRDIGQSGCQVSQSGVVVSGSYAAPSYTLTHTNTTCAGNDGSISASSLVNGRSPFVYTIVEPSASSVGATSTTGNFTNLIAGGYTIRLEDSCGGIQTRTVTIETFTWNINNVSVTRRGCDSADVTIRLLDNAGNNNTSGSAFSGFLYGIVNSPGDTTWYSNHTNRIFLMNKRTVNVVVKDPCGVIRSSTWNLPAGQMPSVGSVVTSNYTCNTFRAVVTGQQNLVDPQYCIYNSSNVQVGCNNTGVFDNIPYGSYCIRIIDNCFDTTIERCFISNPPIPSVNAAVSMSNQNCTTFTATITGQSNLTNPEYCLVNAANDTIACNGTGVFTNIPYGNYCIRIKDACYDTTINRCFTATRPAPFINAVRVTSASCNSLVVDMEGQANLGTGRFCLYDGNMVLIECNDTGVFTNIPQGNYCIRTISECGDTSAPYCVDTRVNRPQVGNAVIVTNRQCTSFSVSIGGTTNLNNPQYELLNSNNEVIANNTNGTFTGVPYGSYCIRIINDPVCYDTTILRCFTEVKPPINITANMTQSNTTCTSFTANITGSGLTNPRFVLYNSSNVALDSNSTGVFTGLPYGTYCVDVRDGCDTTIRVCQTFQPERGVTLSSYVTCTINSATIAAQMQSRNNPFTFNFYHPDGRLLHTVANTWSSWVSVDLPALPAGAQYKVVGIDNCGRRDSAFVTPVATIVTRNVDIRQRCPSGLWPNGSGDIVVSVTSNLYTTTPRLFKKDGVVINQNHNTRSGNNYYFNNVGPATYIIEYTMQQCNSRIYDTVVLGPYVSPTQRNSAIYQCDNNSFSVNSNVVNGVGPFTYEIIGSNPSTPSIITGPQSSPFFNINNGTTYSLVRLRAVDACGNAALDDAAVLPLGNIVITASSQCLYHDITLYADTIPNASYEWYKKTGPDDSTLVGTGLSYNIPFMMEDDRGTYVCKVTVNDECLTKLAYTTLDGQCHDGVLPVKTQLYGQQTAAGNKLQWTVDNDKEVLRYNVERMSGSYESFVTIGSFVPDAGIGRSMSYIDVNPAKGANVYRIRVELKSGSVLYSNTVSLSQKDDLAALVYPNPVRDAFVVSINSGAAYSYQLDLLDVSGKKVFTKRLDKIKTFQNTYKREGWRRGIYLLRIVRIEDGHTESFKLLME